MPNTPAKQLLQATQQRHAKQKFSKCTLASETTVLTAFKSTAVSMVVFSASMVLWKLLTTSQKCIRWMTKVISSFCTCGSSVLESSRILQPEVSSNFPHSALVAAAFWSPREYCNLKSAATSFLVSGRYSLKCTCTHIRPLHRHQQLKGLSIQSLDAS